MDSSVHTGDMVQMALWGSGSNGGFLGGPLTYRERLFWDLLLVVGVTVEVRALCGQGRIPPLTRCIRYWLGITPASPRRHWLRPLFGAFLIWLFAHILYGVPGVGKEWGR